MAMEQRAYTRLKGRARRLFSRGAGCKTSLVGVYECVTGDGEPGLVLEPALTGTSLKVMGSGRPSSEVGEMARACTLTVAAPERLSAPEQLKK